MIQSLGSPSVSFQGQPVANARDTYNAVMEKNNEIQASQNELLNGTLDPQQGQKLNVVA